MANTNISQEGLITVCGVLLFLIVILILGFFIEPDFCQDVDGKWSGFTEAELMEGYDG